MTKSKVLTLDVRAGKVREYHQIAMHAANQATGAAIFAGLELRAIQDDLKKKVGGNFEKWVTENQATLGFSPRTAFKYTALAKKVSNKLLAARDPSIDRLLSLAPSQMNGAQAKLLLQTVHKSVGGVELNELYLDYGIVKPPRKDPGTISRGGGTMVVAASATTAAAAPAPAPATRGPVDTKLFIQDELFGRLDKAGKMIEAWTKPVKIGNAKVAIWQTMSEEQKAEMERQLKVTIAQHQSMLAQLQEARGKKK